MNLFTTYLISFLIGFIAMSQEIIWFRISSFTSAGSPVTFGVVLGLFLLGVALGSLQAKKLTQEKTKAQIIELYGLLLSLATILFITSFPIMGQLYAYALPLGVLFQATALVTIALINGSLFPILCHLGFNKNKPAGLQTALVYIANILGSTLGPIFTGFFLLNWLPIQEVIMIISTGAFVLTICFYVLYKGKINSTSSLVAAVSLLVLFVTHSFGFDNLLEKLLFKNYYSGQSFKYVTQTRSGIIAVKPNKNNDDIIYGDGAYDGRFNIDPVLNSNGILRAYAAAILHPKPEKVLEIGMSSASWARVLANHKLVKQLDIIEINEGYLKAIAPYPQSNSILTDPKVNIYIDDGRRWLKRNPTAKYDFILMNTTMHWRSHATNLLSYEFLSMLKKHLNPGGVIYFNSTNSKDCFYTAARTFENVAKYNNFVAASDSPFSMSLTEKLQNIRRFHIPIKSEEHGKEVEKVLIALAETKIDNVRQDFLDSHFSLITDNNMLSEYGGSRLFIPEFNWDRIRL